MKLVQFRVYVVASFVAGVFALGGAAAQGQRPQGGGPAGGAMLVDFTAVMADGKPVAELAPADVAIKVGGKARTISSLTLKRFAAPAVGADAPPAAAAAPPSSGPSAPYFTNDPAAAPPPPPPPAAAGGRSFLIVVETESLPPGSEPGLKTAIEGLLKELTPADRVAFSLAPHDSAQLGFGSSLASVRQAVAGVRGQKPNISNSDDADAAALCRTSETLNLLKAMMQGTPGGETPTAVVFISGSLSTVGTASSKASTGTTCNVIQDQYNALSGATSIARANMYVVQGDPGKMGRDNGLDNLAGVTGAGAVMRVSGDGFAPRVLTDASAYWVATLQPDPADKPGVSQRLEVKAAKPEVTIHARPEVVMTRPAAAGGAAPAPADAKGGGAKTPKDMLASTAPFTDLQLRAYAVVQRGAGDKMNVLVWAEPTDPAAKIAAMRVGFFDSSNKGPALDAPQIATYPITTLLPVAQGQYRIRVAATDASGKSGAVDVKLDTKLVTAGPFKLGGLWLLGQTDKGMTPKLQFSSDDKIGVMFEVYGIITPDARMKIGFEIAESDTGAFKKAYPPTGSKTTDEPDKFQVFGEIPVGDLAPGDYVIRGVVQQEGQPEGKTIRTFRKIAK